MTKSFYSNVGCHGLRPTASSLVLSYISVTPSHDSITLDPLALSSACENNLRRCYGDLRSSRRIQVKRKKERRKRRERESKLENKMKKVNVLNLWRKNKIKVKNKKLWNMAAKIWKQEKRKKQRKKNKKESKGKRKTINEKAKEKQIYIKKK